jgi:hypothetical protein
VVAVLIVVCACAAAANDSGASAAATKRRFIPTTPLDDAADLFERENVSLMSTLFHLAYRGKRLLKANRISRR